MVHWIRSLVTVAAIAAVSVMVSGAAIAADDDAQILDPMVVAQQACQQRNQGCGAGHDVGPCCADLWCQNGACQPFQQNGEPCGTSATPPCEPGLACGTDGRCHQPG